MHKASGGHAVRRRLWMFLIACMCAGSLHAQEWEGIAVHGFVTQGFLFSSTNNYLTMKSSEGSLRWTDGAVSASRSFTDNLRAGIQLHMYQLGDLGGAYLQIDWASLDYRVNDHFGIRAGKVKTPIGLFNDSQDVDAVFLWVLLPQGAYPIDNKGFLLAHVGGEVYGGFSLGNAVGRVQYRAYGGRDELDLHGGYIKAIADDGIRFTTAPSGATYGGDLRWQPPLPGLTLGFSGLMAALDGTAPIGALHLPSFFANASYAEFKKGKFDFAGEYRREATQPILLFGPEAFPVPRDQRFWFAMGSYRIRKSLQAGSYYSHYANRSADTSLPQNYSADWVVSGRYDFNTYFYGKLEGHFLHGTGLGYYADSNANGLKTNSNMLAVKIGFSF